MVSLEGYNHPSLVLGNIADARVVDCLKQINVCRSSEEIAKEKMNALILFKRSITMTLNELSQIGVDTLAIEVKIKEINDSISMAAEKYLSAKLDAENNIILFKERMSALDAIESPGSPLDFESSPLKSMPSFCDSMKLDSQYFSFESRVQGDRLSDIERFIRLSTEGIGGRSEEVSNAVCAQISNQMDSHSICGTLILVASCTHRNVRMFSPLKLDPDRAIEIWNRYIQNKILPSDLRSFAENAFVDGLSQSDLTNSLPLVYGAAYGSSFVGMVHILNSENSMAGDMDQLLSQLNKKLKMGGWLENASGGFGVDKDLLKEVKAFLSSKSISSHVSLVTMGVIPSLKGRELNKAVESVKTVENSAVSGIEIDLNLSPATMTSSSEVAKRNALLVKLQNARINNVLNTVGEIDWENNKTMDIGSLIEAFDAYVDLINEDSKNDPQHVIGVPIHFYIKNITRREILQQWAQKYDPDKPDQEE